MNHVVVERLSNAVLVFRTSVEHNREVEKLRPVLDKLIIANEKWNFDLEDCDRILRVESYRLHAAQVSDALFSAGYFCEELED